MENDEESDKRGKSIKHTRTEFHKNRNNALNNVNLISNNPLYSLKETFICVFCGGKNCKHENFKNHANPAIYGLNSDKIDDNIFASQRPANSLIKEYDLIKKFKELNIGLIVNLQLPGEHPYCGPIDKLDESGFAYSPSLFESEGIHVGLYGWKDMNIPNSLNHMLEIVKSMYHYIHQLKKRVLVHCHAGYGRTGIVIACFKIFDESITAEVAKTEIRKIRPKCIQNKDQLLYCTTFEEFIRRLRANFYLQEKRTIETFIKNQNDLNVNKYTFIHFVYNKSVPLFLLYIFDSIIDIKNKNNLDDYSLYKYLNGSMTIHENAKELINTLSKNINDYNWNILYSCEDPIILCELLNQWLLNSIEYVIEPQHIMDINEDLSDYENKLKTCENQTLLIINKFLSLIKTPSENEEDEDDEIKTEKNNFLKILSKNLLGYSSEELSNNEKENVEKLVKLINYINEEQKDIQIELNDGDDKELMLSNVYEQLKFYFENKNKNKDSTELNKMNSDNIFKNINNLMNKNSQSGSIIEESIKKEVFAKSLNFERQTKNQKIGMRKSINLNNNTSTIKLSKSFKSNLTFKGNKNNQNLFQSVNKVIDEEVEEEKDVPWIREEDC